MHSGIKKYIFSIVCLLLTVQADTLLGTNVQTPAGHKILFLTTYGTDRIWTQNVLQGFVTEIAGYREIYDTQMVSLTQIQETGNGIAQKLKNNDYEVLVALDNPAVNYVLNQYPALPKNLKIICIPDEMLTAFDFQSYKNITGLKYNLLIDENLALGMKLFPKTKHIFLVFGATVYAPNIKAAFEKGISKYPGVKGVTISGGQTSTNDMVTYLKTVPKNSLILFTSWSKSLTVHEFPVQWTVLMNLAAETNVPLLVTSKSLVGYGALGGIVTDGNHLGKTAAQTVKRLVAGTMPDKIQWQILQPEPFFNTATVRKFGLNLSSLPPDSIILDQSTKWMQYKKQFFLAGITLLVSFFILFALLLYFMRYRKQKQRTDALFNLLPITFGIIDQNHEIHLQHGHLQPMGMQYMNTKKLIPENMPEEFQDKIKAFLAKVDEVLKDQLSSTSEFTSNNKHWRLRLYPLPNGILSRPALVWIAEDINDLFRANQKAQELVTNLRTTLSSIGNGVITTDQNETITMINPAASRLTGYSSEEAKGRPLSEIFRLIDNTGSELPPPVRAALSEKKNQVSIVPGKLKSRDGVIHFVTHTTAPVIVNAGTPPTGAVLIFRDVTDECKNREKTHTDKFLLEQTVRIGKIEYFQCDLLGREIFGIPARKENRNIPFNASLESLKKWIYPEDAEKIWSQWQKLLAGDIKELDVEYHVGESTTQEYYRMRVMPELDENSEKIIAYSGIIQDITDNNLLAAECSYMRKNELMIEKWMDGILNKTDSYVLLKQFLDDLMLSLNADRCGFFRLNEHHTAAQCIEETVRDNKASARDRSCKTDFTSLPDIISALDSNGQVLLHDNTPEIPYRQHLEQFSIKTQMLRKITFENKIWGYVEIDFVRANHTFTQMEDILLNTSTKITALLLEHYYNLIALEDGKNIATQIIDASINLVILFDTKGNLKTVNKAVCTLLNKTEEEIRSYKCNLILCNKPAPPENCPLARCMKTGKTQTEHVVIRDRDFRITVQPVFNQNGEIVLYMENGVDITAQKEQDQTMSDHEILAAAELNARTTFMNNINHKMRTPLNTVVGFSELLENALTLTKEQQEYFNGISNAGHNLLNIINNIQELSNLENGKVQLKNEPMDLLPALQPLLQEIRQKAEAKGLEFQVELPTQLPRMSLDVEKIKKVLEQLLLNAIQNTNRGYVRLDSIFATISYEEQKGKLTFNISDTGSGFPVSDLEQLQTFLTQRTLNSTSRYSGSGLGLPIAIYLTNAMKGKLSASSIEYVGTVFTFELEVRFIEKRHMEVPVGQTAKTEKTESNLVLVVDDIELNLKLISAMLRRLNVNFVTTTSGQAALEIAKNRDVALILSDVWMPNMTGEELAEKLAADPVTASIPIVAVTADTQVKEGRFSEVLYKPIKLDNLSAIINQYCRKE